MSEDDPPSFRIALVGPCASGKSTLAKVLKVAGYQVKQPVQEHSYVPNMWQRLTSPDVLIYLDLDFENLQRRRPKNHGGPERLVAQHQLLTHAYEHCDLYVDTSDLTPVEIQEKVLAFLKKIED
jgi:deoxyadenosine/deoxycytidine kinase